MIYLDYLESIAQNDVALLMKKEQTYKGSWKKRGGVGAFMMAARKWDRLENILSDPFFNYDIFKSDDVSGADGTVLSEIRDLRCYLLLIESEILALNEKPKS